MDTRVLDWVVAHRTPWLTDVFTVITDVGGLLVMTVLTTVVAIVLAVRRQRANAVLIGGSMLSGWLVMNLLKLAIGRERPPVPLRLVEEMSSAMPSGHAMLSAVLVCVVGAVVHRSRNHDTPRAVYVALGAWSVLVGLSRVYLGAHWLTDVLVGWALGAAWAALWIAGRQFLRPVKSSME